MTAGRPSSFSQAIADEICDRLASGDSLVQICARDGMPGLRTVMRWAAENIEFGTEYAQAREAQAEFMDDKILTAAADAKADPQAARVQIEAYKWRAAKLAPKRYGDAQTIRHADANGEKIEIDDVSRAARLAALADEINRGRPDAVD